MRGLLIEIITPSYARDREYALDLSQSIFRHAKEPVRHQLLVPRGDRAAFEGGGVYVTAQEDVFPSRYIPLAGTRYFVNVRRPIPPVRGWIRQQIAKLAAAAASSSPAVAVIDSDVAFIRDFDESSLVGPSAHKLYRLPDAVDSQLPRHVIWHKVARAILGLTPGQPPFPDYVSPLLVWEPPLVRAMLSDIEKIASRSWIDVISKQLHFSESTLYGTYLEHVLGWAADRWTTSSRCVTHWNETPLTAAEVRDLANNAAPTDLAMMISAKSGTSLSDRRSVLGHT